MIYGVVFVKSLESTIKEYYLQEKFVLIRYANIIR